MKKNLIRGAALLVLSVAFPSCAYDPYYSSVGASYSQGYGYGYGYGGSGFSTTYFVSTGDPRWGYDPYCHSYYDYRRRCYYDPYLYGYYPVGYRPPAVIGVPHPHSWRPGHGYCPPPRVIRDVTVPNYRNREVAYRGVNQPWAKQVKQRPVTGTRPTSGYQDRGNPASRPNTAVRPPQNPGGFFGRPATSSRPGGATISPRQPNTGRQPSAAPPRSGSRQPQAARPPAAYNTPVTRTVQQPRQQGPATRPAGPSAQPRIQREAPPQRAQPQQPRREESRPAGGGNRGLRSLGQG